MIKTYGVMVKYYKGGGILKIKFKKGILLGVFLLITLILTLSHVINHYSILTKEYSTEWGENLKIDNIGLHDNIWLSKTENNIEYIKLKENGELTSHKILVNGELEYSTKFSSTINGFDETIFKYDIKYDKKNLYYLKDKKLYSNSIETGKELLVADSLINKMNTFEDDITYVGYYKENTIFILNDKKVVFKKKMDQKIINFDFIVRDKTIELYTIENKSYKENQILVYKFEDSKLVKTKVLKNIDLLQGYNVYRLQANKVKDITYLSYAQLQDDWNSNIGDIYIQKINSETLNYYNLSFLNEENEFIDKIHKNYVINFDSSGINLVLSAKNLKNEITKFSDIVDIEINNNLKIQGYKFIDTSYSYSRVGDVQRMNGSEYVLSKDLNLGTYDVFINSNSPEYISKKDIPKSDVKSAIMQGVLSPLYSIMHLFINLIKNVIFLLLPFMILGCIFFIKKVESEKLKFGLLYFSFAVFYLYDFSNTYVSNAVIRYAPSYLTSNVSLIIVPILIMMFSLGIVEFYRKKIHVDADYVELIIVGILTTIYVSTLMYAPYNYVQVILMYG